MTEILIFLAELIKHHPRFFEGLGVSMWMVLVVWYYDHLNDKKKRNTKALACLMKNHIDQMYYGMVTNAKAVIDSLKYDCNKSCEVDAFVSEFGAFQGHAKAILREDHIQEIFRSLEENGFSSYGPVRLEEYKKTRGATIGQNGRMRIGIYDHQFPHIASSKKCSLSIDMNIKMYSEVVDQYLLNKKSEVPFWKLMASLIPVLKKFISFS